MSYYLEPSKESSLKTTLIAVFAVLATAHASAQTTYSFSGSSWGESLASFDQKIRASGFSGCAILEKLKCSAATLCACTFTGDSIRNGWAVFEKNKLEQIFVNVYDHAATTQILIGKYGPRHPSRNVSNLGVFPQSEELLQPPVELPSSNCQQY